MSKFSTTVKLIEKTAAKAWILAVSIALSVLGAAPFAQAGTVTGKWGAWNNFDCCEKWKQLRVLSPECMFPNTVGVIE